MTPGLLLRVSVTDDQLRAEHDASYYDVIFSDGGLNVDSLVDWIGR